MRIVAGEHRGRRLEAPKGKTVRPTSSLAREALFNVLGHGRFAVGGSPVVGATVLDAFAGSGANGLEALSQGAAHAVFMESNKAALAALRENVATLGEGARSNIITCDVRFPPRARRACELVIMDPPYGEDLAAPALTALRAADWMASGALIAVEMAKGETFTSPEGFALLDTRHYGKAQIVFLEADPAP